MRSLRGERGSASVLIIGLSVVVLVGVGFAVDGTRKGQVYSEATSIAEEAARAGGQALRSHALAAGTDADVDPQLAAAEAQRYLAASGASGDAGRYREIFDFNRGRTKPDGHLPSDPDLSRPGDVLRIPHPAPRASGGGGAPASAAFHHAQVQDSCQIPSPPPTPPVPPSPPAKPSPDVRVPVSTSNPSTQVNPSSETDDSATVAAGVGGLLAAGLLTLLAVRRRRARQPQSERTRVLLSAIPLNEDVAQRLLQCGPDAIVTADGDDGPLPGAWCLDVEGPRTFVESLGVAVELQRLSRAQVANSSRCWPTPTNLSRFRPTTTGMSRPRRAASRRCFRSTHRPPRILVRRRPQSGCSAPSG
jgi:MYXO-CTERM domain-containing protein